MRRTEPVSVDAVIVLGAGVRPDGSPSPALRRRLDGGVAIFRKVDAKALIVTGGPAGRAPTEAQVMAGLAREAGIPEASILLDPDSNTTMENAANAAQLMVTRGWRRAIVVTDRVHLPRGLLAFAGLGLSIRGHGVPKAWRQSPFRSAFHYMAYETAAIAWYAVLLASGRRARYTGR